jgi:hypothetical protein
MVDQHDLIIPPRPQRHDRMSAPSVL